MNKEKGFTLIEIIGAIVILGIIAIIAFATYTSSLKGFRDSYYTSLERTLTKSGQEFFGDNRNYRPNGILLAQDVSISTLMSKNYVSKVVDYNGDACDNRSYVMVIKEGREKYAYHTCLICGEDGYDNTQEDKYCDRTWLDPTKVEYGLGSIETIYIYKGTTREELKDLLELPVSYVRKDNDGNTLAEIRGTGEGEPTILPKNIDVVNTNVVGDYTVIYEYKNDESPRTVKVYENDEPTISYTMRQKRLKNLAGEEETITEENYTSGRWAQNVIVHLDSKAFEVEGLTTSRFQWNKDGRWQDFCETDPCTKTVTEEMNQTIQFRLVDTNGNISKTTEPYTFRIDNTKPRCSLTIPTDIGENNWYKTDVVINFSAYEDDRNSNTNLTSGKKYWNILPSTENLTSELKSKNIITNTQSEDISSVVYVGFVIDEAENYITCTTPTFKRDATLPNCTNSADPTTWVNTSRTVTWGCSDPTVNGTKSNCDPSFSGSSHTYTTTTVKDTISSYTIKDLAGNEKVCPEREAIVYVDQVKPVCTDSGDSTEYATSRTIYWGCTDTLSGCDSNHDGGSTPFTTTTVTATIPAYTIKDTAGNEETCSERTANVYVDATNPSCTDSGDNTTWTHDDITIYWGCSDNNSGCDPDYDGGSKVFNRTTQTATIPAYTIKDNVGNTTTCPARTANVYVSKEVTCSAGNYLPKNSGTCAKCPANHYCSGGKYTTYQSSDQGIRGCSSGYSSPAGSSGKGSCCKKKTSNCCSAGSRFDGSSTSCVDWDYYNGPDCRSGWECIYGSNHHCYGNAISYHTTGACSDNCHCVNVVGTWGPYCTSTVCE